MFVGLIPVAFGILVIAAGAFDFVRQRIPNWIVLALAALFLLQAVRHLHEVFWIGQLGVGLACLLVGMLLYALGQLGAGDAKLLAAVSLWAGLAAVLPWLFLIAIAGLLVVALLVAARRVIAWRKWNAEGKLPRSLVAGQGVPFGVAIAIGTLFAMQLFPPWLWRP
jgi:prepilin peptidase CpaA